MLSIKEKDFSFCTLALGEKYRFMVKELATDLEQYSPGTSLIVYTDVPKDLNSCQNVLAFKHIQKGVSKCYHDKRFVIEKALSMFRVAIFIDADTRIVNKVSDSIEWLPGITSGVVKNILLHGGNKNHPMRLKSIKSLSEKLGVSLEQVNWTEENLFIVARDGGREIEFIKQWGKLATYFELRHIHSGEGNAIGLAAAKVGWTFNNEGWDAINKVRNHSYAHCSQGEFRTLRRASALDKLKTKFGYNYRINTARIIAALSDFNFYYR